MTAAELIASRKVRIGPNEAVAPTSEDELATVLAHATDTATSVAIWGGGTHRDMGHWVDADLIVSTSALTGIVEWQPEDLTVVVRAGTPIADLEAELAGGGQTAVLPETAGKGTVGGMVATAASGYRRLRYGPTRDRMLEVRAVTGDGRQVKGGGRVVKNVSGYDLPHLYTGSFGSLGVITSVCLKLWPLTKATATVSVDDASRATAVHRPLAVLETPDGVSILLAGTEPEVTDQVERLGGIASSGLNYPDPVTGESAWSIRVPPAKVTEAIRQVPADSEFVAQHGVGEISFGAPVDFDPAEIRAWAGTVGGVVVRLRGSGPADPWGPPPLGLALQKRVIAAFDPKRILEPGRLPGGI